MDTDPRRRISAPAIINLAGQVVKELKDPKQFLDPARREELLRNGIQHFRGALLTVHLSPLDQLIDVSNRIELARVVQRTPDGIDVITDPGRPLAAFIFPAETGIDYSAYTAGNYPGVPRGYVFMGPVNDVAQKDDTRGLPMHGIRKGPDVLIPIRDRNDESAIQHGGFMAHKGDLQVLNWNELADAWDDPMCTEATVAQGDWFMEASTQQQVVARPNLYNFPRMYNALGELELANGERLLLALSTNSNTYGDYAGANIHTTPRTALITEVAAMANTAAIHAGAVDWRLCGMELTGGGLLLPGARPHYIGNRSHFILTPPS